MHFRQSFWKKLVRGAIINIIKLLNTSRSVVEHKCPTLLPPAAIKSTMFNFLIKVTVKVINTGMSFEMVSEVHNAYQI